MNIIGGAIKLRRISILVFFGVLIILTGCANQVSPSTSGQTAKPAPIVLDSSRFVVAGSGTNLPITEKLAAAYNKKTTEVSKCPRVSAQMARSRQCRRERSIWG